MQADGPRGHRGKGRVHLGQRLAAHRLPAVGLARRDDLQRLHPRHRVVAEDLRRQRAPVLERRLLAHAVQSGDEAAQPAQGVGIVQLGAVAAAHRCDGQAEGLALDQHLAQRGRRRGHAGQRLRRHHRHLGSGQLGAETVLLGNLRIGPAAGPVELGHHAGAVLQHHLEHPVLVAVELQQAAVATQADIVQGVEHGLGRQPGKWVVGRGGSGHGQASRRARRPRSVVQWRRGLGWKAGRGCEPDRLIAGVGRQARQGPQVAAAGDAGRLGTRLVLEKRI